MPISDCYHRAITFIHINHTVIGVVCAVGVNNIVCGWVSNADWWRRECQDKDINYADDLGNNDLPEWLDLLLIPQSNSGAAPRKWRLFLERTVEELAGWVCLSFNIKGLLA